MSIPHKNSCDVCGRDFETCIPGQTTCNVCLLKPSGPDKDVSAGDSSSKRFKEKVCKCGARYLPTSGSQKLCPKCIEKRDAGKKCGSRGGIVSPKTFERNINDTVSCNPAQDPDAPARAPDAPAPKRYPRNISLISAQSDQDAEADRIMALVRDLLDNKYVSSVVVALRKG